VGGLVIAGWNAVLLAGTLAGRRPERILTPMVLGAAGGAVIVFGWLAAARVESHSYGFLTTVPAIVTLAALCVLVSLSALAPAGCLRPGRS
jgi:hypothetical protein